MWRIILLILASLACLVQAKQLDPQPDVSSHSIAFYNYLKTQSPKDRPYLRGISYYNYKTSKLLPTRVSTMKFWVNQLHLETDRSFCKPITDTLYVLDLRDFGWSSEAFSAVARREPYFVEPAVDSSTAILLREYAGIKQDKKTLHAETIVRGDWLFRETMESDRSPSYYDLLFSKFRFKKKVTERWKYSDGSIRDKVVGGGFVNFPKDEADFERVFGVDKFHEYLKEFKIDTRHGAVVEGIENGVSIVARQNRLIERIQTFTGAYYKTFDVKETTGKRDFAETLNKDFEFDAGEILCDLPGGGMAALLVDSKGKIVETADNRFAIDNSDGRLDARVRTPGSCFICHVEKYISPKNLVEEMVKSGIDILTKDKRRSIEIKGFFLDWVDKLETEQTRFGKFIARTSGFKPAENAVNLKNWRDEYDRPVDLAIAATETGLTIPALKLILAESTKARAALLFKGFKIPRRTFEVDVYREIIHLKNAGDK